jgi:hypothetical protein
VNGSKNEVGKRAHELAEKLADLNPFLFPAAMRSLKGYQATLLLKIKNWPDENLLTRLRSLPPFAAIDVNPETLW